MEKLQPQPADGLTYVVVVPNFLELRWEVRVHHDVSKEVVIGYARRSDVCDHWANVIANSTDPPLAIEPALAAERKVLIEQMEGLRKKVRELVEQVEILRKKVKENAKPSTG
jgi:hypothetical protein